VTTPPARTTRVDCLYRPAEHEHRTRSHVPLIPKPHRFGCMSEPDPKCCGRVWNSRFGSKPTCRSEVYSPLQKTTPGGRFPPHAAGCPQSPPHPRSRFNVLHPPGWPAIAGGRSMSIPTWQGVFQYIPAAWELPFRCADLLAAPIAWHTGRGRKFIVNAPQLRRAAGGN